MPVCAISNMSGYIPPSIYPGFNPKYDLSLSFLFQFLIFFTHSDNTILSETESSGSETFKVKNIFL